MTTPINSMAVITKSSNLNVMYTCTTNIDLAIKYTNELRVSIAFSLLHIATFDFDSPLLEMSPKSSNL